MKDGAPIPLLEMTYINKTKPMPCDKEVNSVNDEFHLIQITLLIDSNPNR